MAPGQISAASCPGQSRASARRACDRPYRQYALDHELELHELELHELELQELELQEEPLHELDDHTLALQDEPLHEEPLHDDPAHSEPFHQPPDHELALASSSAIAAESKGLPKMSCSPTSSIPPFVTWSDPRAPSSEPVPVDEAAVFVQRGVLKVRADARLSVPFPCRSGRVPVSADAVSLRIFFTWSGVIVGRWSRISAAAPATTAAA